MNPPNPCLTRLEFEKAERSLLSRGSKCKPAVWSVKSPQGGMVIVKDAQNSTWLWRPLARYLLFRELRALKRIQGLQRVPQYLGRLDGCAFAMSSLEGQPLDKEGFLRSPRVFADALAAIARSIHQRGVFHLDLRQRQNVLVGPDGLPNVVDFGGALTPGGLGLRLWGRLLAWVDLQAPWKFLARWAAEEMTQEEARALVRAQRWRRLWVLSPHRDDGEWEAAKRRAKS
jgi:hypothetical protein